MDTNFTTSSEVAALYAALATAQGSMGAASKDARNPHFKSRYASLAAVLEAVLPPLNEQGLVLMQHPAFDGDLVTLTTVLAHKSGQYISSTCAAPLGKRDAQGVGSAITYLRRYAAQSICGLPVDDDDGNAASRRSAPPARPVAPTVPLKQLEDCLADNDLTLTDMATWCEAHGRPAPVALSSVRRQQLMEWIDSTGAAKVKTWFVAQAEKKQDDEVIVPVAGAR